MLSTNWGAFSILLAHNLLFDDDPSSIFTKICNQTKMQKSAHIILKKINKFEFFCKLLSKRRTREPFLHVIKEEFNCSKSFNKIDFKSIFCFF
ncbi:hypothetical protein EGR_08828 [Echinococcus granulosus]|uniref:Uncharacterized protein n=1 Tax=Echinococcus granulosus TaxID=6210 RepID=W6U532_ECHGR|nr:hypothetical protein EGR_08828 [Echinococcus granulosus]EUB56283.1 hypothetical protein EGR_08828 [Echinococcus granulosus]